jgi:hypothetical protein
MGGGRKGEAVNARKWLPFYASTIPLITSDKGLLRCPARRKREV